MNHASSSAMNLHTTILEATIGLGSLAIAGVISFKDHIEQDVRIAALSAALVVSILTAAKMAIDIRRRLKGPIDE